jgi:glutamate formiminotransferase
VAVIEHLTNAVRAVRHVRLLDVHSDPAHHRTVLTLVGEARPLVEAATCLVEAGVRLVDLRRHRGVHPRVGAVDVIPFVPLARTTMADAVVAATEAASAIAARAGVPVFLYEAAATTPARRRLEDVRRGQFEGLAEKMAHPDWRPDVGPATPHASAGATVVGARPILVAFNVVLDTARLDIGRAVARAVRASSGGLPHVKAMALVLSGPDRIQVSMNLTDFRVTPLPVAFDAVVREAGRHGAAIVESELVGLVPSAALAGRSPMSLGLNAWEPGRLLDTYVDVS